MATHPKLVVIYDGCCALCRRARRLAELLDWHARLEFVNLHEDAARRAVAPKLSASASQRALHLKLEDGRLLCGFIAIRCIARQLPLLTPISLLLQWPPFSTLGRTAYHRIALKRRCSSPEQTI